MSNERCRLVGFHNPGGEYPAIVAPVLCTGGDYWVAYDGEASSQLNKIDPNAEFVRIGDESRLLTSEFDYSTDYLFAESESRLQRFEKSSLSSFLQNYLASENSSGCDSLIRLTFAFESGSERILLTEFQSAAKAMIQQFPHQSACWYEQMRSKFAGYEFTEQLPLDVDLFAKQGIQVVSAHATAPVRKATNRVEVTDRAFQPSLDELERLHDLNLVIQTLGQYIKNKEIQTELNSVLGEQAVEADVNLVVIGLSAVVSAEVVRNARVALHRSAVPSEINLTYCDSSEAEQATFLPELRSSAATCIFLCADCEKAMGKKRKTRLLEKLDKGIADACFVEVLSGKKRSTLDELGRTRRAVADSGKLHGIEMWDCMNGRIELSPAESNVATYLADTLVRVATMKYIDAVGSSFEMMRSSLKKCQLQLTDIEGAQSVRRRFRKPALRVYRQGVESSAFSSWSSMKESLSVVDKFRESPEYDVDEVDLFVLTLMLNAVDQWGEASQGKGSSRSGKPDAAK